MLCSDASVISAIRGRLGGQNRVFSVLRMNFEVETAKLRWGREVDDGEEDGGQAGTGRWTMGEEDGGRQATVGVGRPARVPSMLNM